MDEKNRERIIFHIDVNSAYLSWSALQNLENGASEDPGDSIDYWRRHGTPARSCAGQIGAG